MAPRGPATRKTKRKNVPPPGPYQCHPRVGDSTPSQGCLPIEVLTSAAQKLGVPTSPLRTLRKRLADTLQVAAENERSFVNALPLSVPEKEALAKTYLRPPMPEAWKKDPDMWLDSNNIAHVMKQYEEAHPDFEFMGPYPIDFAAPDPQEKSPNGKPKCLMNEMCELRVLQAKEKGTRGIGIVQNLDPHFKSGSHWVASYIDLVNHRCLQFDSQGYQPPKQIAVFMKWLTQQDPKMKLEYNARRFQFKNSECGMQSLQFIIRMFSGDKFVDFSRVAPKDAVMLNLRKWLFST